MGRRDLNRAPLKDTVIIPAGGYAVVYFRANNPGYWFLHCHIEVHQLEGMAVVINDSTGKLEFDLRLIATQTFSTVLYTEKCPL